MTPTLSNISRSSQVITEFNSEGSYGPPKTFKFVAEGLIYLLVWTSFKSLFRLNWRGLRDCRQGSLLALNYLTVANILLELLFAHYFVTFYDDTSHKLEQMSLHWIPSYSQQWKHCWFFIGYRIFYISILYIIQIA